VEGTGPAAKPGDTLKVRFLAVDRSGKEVYDTWSEKEPFTFELGTGDYGSGWDKGLTGAKAGGQLELSVPGDEAFEKQGPLYYVVEVLEVQPASSKGGEAQGGGANPGQ
jgi:FKBP-type peptidyl-prolyl cis-trans isomerase